MKAKRFWDRVYYGGHVTWNREQQFVPSGAQVMGTMGYQLNGQASVKLRTGAQVSILKENAVNSELYPSYEAGLKIGNFTLEGMADHRVWNFLFVTAGCRGTLQDGLAWKETNAQGAWEKVQWGVPVGIQTQIALSNGKKSTAELTIDMSSLEKPTLNFNVGFLFNKN